MNEDGCFEQVLSCPPDSNWLPMTPETGTLASPEWATAAIQVLKPGRSVLGDSHNTFARPKRTSDFSSILNLYFNFRRALSSAIRHRHYWVAKPA